MESASSDMITILMSYVDRKFLKQMSVEKLTHADVAEVLVSLSVPVSPLLSLPFFLSQTLCTTPGALIDGQRCSLRDKVAIPGLPPSCLLPSTSAGQQP